MAVANGYGSTNTRVRRWTNTLLSIGADITISQSAANGDKFTVNVDGVYHVSYCDQFNSNAVFGIVKNGTEGATAINGVTETASQVVLSAAQVMTNLNIPNTASWCGFFQAGDYVWAQTLADPSGTNTEFEKFCITRIS